MNTDVMFSQAPNAEASSQKDSSPFQAQGPDLKNGTSNPAISTTPIHTEKKPYHRGNIGFVLRSDSTARPHAIIWIRAGATG